MAFFGVTIETIKTIDPIEGADRIQRATLENVNFQFVIGKDIFKVGEKVLYFPIDSVIPEELAKALGVFGKLAGKSKDRVKTIKLKGCLSQGVVGPVSLIASLTDPTPEVITEFLKVVKYEPPTILEKGANLRALPCDLTIYDIEGCERHGKIVDLLMPQTVHISEKMEGSNFSVSFDGEKVYVNQRRHTIELIEGIEPHTWWRVATEEGLIDHAKKLQAKYGKTATIYGEMTGPGIQGNIYKLAKHTIFVFDVKIGENFMDAVEYIVWTKDNNINVAPTIAISTLEEFLKP
jgi:RNA ligase (TIGR02306 family)